MFPHKNAIGVVKLYRQTLLSSTWYINKVFTMSLLYCLDINCFNNLMMSHTAA